MHWKKLLTAIVFVFFLFVNLQAQASKKVSLLVSNCEPTESPCKTNHLYRYNFVNGEYVSKELIVTSKTDEVNFGLGKNRIYQNRYALTSWGDVIDIEKKRILHKSAGELFRVDGNKIHILVNTTKTEGLFVYDLVSNEYKLVNKIDSIMHFGEISPNGVRSALYTCSDCGIKILEYGGKEKLIKGNFTVQRDGLNTSSFNKAPIFWLDEERFITQTKNGHLVTVDINGKISPLVNFKIEGLESQNPKIYRNDEGKIIYHYVSDYEIDVENKTYKPLNESVGNDFAAEYSNTGEEKFFYKDSEIGRFDSPIYPTTTTGYIAAEYGEKGVNGGYSLGVKAWNTIKKDWTTIEIKWSPKIIGWIIE